MSLLAVLTGSNLLPAIACAGMLLALACTPDEHPLAGTSWTLLSIGGNPAIGDVDVEFSEERGISGWTGCNSYDGRYSTSGSSLATHDLRWTEAGCPSRELFMQESLYTDLLVDAEGFATGGSELAITSSDGQTMIFALRK